MIASKRKADANGWWEIARNPISKVGVFPYLGSSIGAPEPDRVYMVYRPAEELSAPEAIESFKLLPWVDDHDFLGDDEDIGLMPAEQKGVHGVIGENVVFDPADETLYANIKIFSRALKQQIDNGKRELSAGYRCVYDFTPGVYQGIKYDAVQRQHRGNHLALVDRGRMGPDVAVLDHLKFTVDAKELEPMSKLTPLQAAQAAHKAAVDTKATDAVIAACDAAVKAAQTAQDEAEAEEEEKGEDTKSGGKDTGHESAPGGADAADALKGLTGADALSAAKDLINAQGKQIAALTAGNAALTASVKALEARPALDASDVFAMGARKTKLAEDLSWHVGSFDHAAMDLAGVVAYGLDKLGLKDVPKGHEQTALETYLGAKPRPAGDRAEIETGDADAKRSVSEYLSA